MKCIIKNPAPLDDRLHMWGDYHFGEALSRALDELGWGLATHYHGEWDKADDADVVLVIRGRHRYDPPAAHRAEKYMVWVISHPGAVSADELRQFDRVFVASEKHRRVLAGQSIRAEVLLQCTDTTRFFPPENTNESDLHRRGFIFVANTRSEKREIADWAIDAGLPLSIWGRGWGRFGLTSHVVDKFIANEKLPELYRNARCTLNDHWPDMREFEYVNNRIFDALACGLPVLSDAHPGLDALGFDGVLTFNDRAEFQQQLERLLLEYPLILDAAAADARAVRRDHTFAQRARVMADHLSANSP